MRGFRFEPSPQWVLFIPRIGPLSSDAFLAFPPSLILPPLGKYVTARSPVSAETRTRDYSFTVGCSVLKRGYGPRPPPGNSCVRREEPSRDQSPGWNRRQLPLRAGAPRCSWMQSICTGPGCVRVMSASEHRSDPSSTPKFAPRSEDFSGS